MPDIYDDLANSYLQGKTTSPSSSYDSLFQKHGDANGVDPDLLKAMTHQESTFKPNAVSPKGARGLMQLMPDTARRFGVKNINDPDQNIAGGAKYMKFLLDKFGGNVDKALAGYNAGEGAVDKYKGIPPYKETRDYVKKIRSNYSGGGYADAPSSYDQAAQAYLGNSGQTSQNDHYDQVAESYLSGENQNPVAKKFVPPPTEPTQTLPSITPVTDAVKTAASNYPDLSALDSIPANVGSNFPAPASPIQQVKPVRQPLNAQKQVATRPTQPLQNVPTQPVSGNNPSQDFQLNPGTPITPDSIFNPTPPKPSVALGAEPVVRDDEEPAVLTKADKASLAKTPALNSKPKGTPVVGIVDVDPKLNPEEKVRQAANKLLVGRQTPTGPITPDDIDKWIQDSKAAGVPVSVGNPNSKQTAVTQSMLDQIYDSKKKGDDQLEEERKNRYLDRVAPKLTDEQLKQQAIDNLSGPSGQISGISNAKYSPEGSTPQADTAPSDTAIQQEMDRLKSTQLTDEQRDGIWRDAKDFSGPDWKVPKAIFSAIGYGGGGQILHLTAGALRPFSAMGIPDGYSAVSRWGTMAKLADAAQSDTGVGNEPTAGNQITKAVAGGLYGLAPIKLGGKVMQVAKLGESGFGLFAGMGALEEAGKGGSAKDIVTGARKGLEQDIAFRLGAIPKSLVGKGAATFAGTMAVNAAEGEPLAENVKSSLSNAAFAIHGALGEKAEGNSFRIWEDNKPNDIYIDKDKNVSVLKPDPKRKVSGGEVVVDPKNPVYTNPQQFANAPKSTKTLSPEQVPTPVGEKPLETNQPTESTTPPQDEKVPVETSPAISQLEDVRNDPDFKKQRILFIDPDGNYITKEKQGYKVWKAGTTNSELAGTIGFEGERGLEKAKERIAQLAQSQGTPEKGFQITDQGVPESESRGIAKVIADKRNQLAEERRKGDTNALTGLGSKQAWEAAKPRIEADPNQEVVSFDINRMKHANDSTDHSHVDENVLKPLGEKVRTVLERNGIDSRNAFTPGGDELVVAVPKGKGEQIRSEIEKEFGKVDITATKDVTNDRTGEKINKGDVIPVTISGSVGNDIKSAEEGLAARKEQSKKDNPIVKGSVVPQSDVSQNLGQAEKRDNEPPEIFDSHYALKATGKKPDTIYAVRTKNDFEVADPSRPTALQTVKIPADVSYDTPGIEKFVRDLRDGTRQPEYEREAPAQTLDESKFLTEQLKGKTFKKNGNTYRVKIVIRDGSRYNVGYEEKNPLSGKWELAAGKTFNLSGIPELSVSPSPQPEGADANSTENGSSRATVSPDENINSTKRDTRRDNGSTNTSGQRESKEVKGRSGQEESKGRTKSQPESTAAPVAKGRGEAEKPEIVQRALEKTVTDIGQLTPVEKKALNKAVKDGTLIKTKGGNYPEPKDVYQQAPPFSKPETPAQPKTPQNEQTATQFESGSSRAPEFKSGDRVQDTNNRKGTIEEKDGKQYVRQLGTEAIIPLSDKWSKTKSQITLDKKAEKLAKKEKKLSIGPGTPAEGQTDVVGSNLKQLTEQIGHLPKSSIKDSVKNALNIADKVTDAKNWVARGIARMKAIPEAISAKTTITDYKKNLGEFLYANQRSDHETRQFVKEIERRIPDKTSREAITNWIQAGGDEATLQKRADASKGSIKKGYEKAINLSDEEKTVARNIESYYDAQFQEGQEAGIINSAIDNYVNQVWKKENPITQKLKVDMAKSTLDPNFKFSKKRVFESFFEGEQAGYTPASKDVAALLSVYNQSFNKAVYSKAFIKGLHGAKASDGRPLVEISGSGVPIKEGDVPEAYLMKPKTKNPDVSDYRTIDHPALRGWKWVQNIDGKDVFMQGDMLVHPEAYNHLKNVLGKSIFSQYAVLRGVKAVNSTIKQTMLSLSAFHPVQIGLHGASHRINPIKAVSSFKLDFDDPVQAKLVKGGLQVSDYNALENFGEGLSGGNLTNKIPIIGKKVLEPYQEWMFKDFIPRLKMMMATDAYKRNTERYKGKLSDAQVAEITASQANAAFGELNYKYMGRNPTFQDVLRTFLLAPDFLEARARFVGQAVKPWGREQLVALGLMAAVQYSTARILNKLLDDDYHWSPEDAFRVWHKGHWYGARTIPTDIMHALTNPRNFTYNRLSPLVQDSVIAVTGKDSFGKPVTPLEQIENIVKQPIPISFKGKKDDQWWEPFVNSFGVQEGKDYENKNLTKEVQSGDKPLDEGLAELKKELDSGKITKKQFKLKSRQMKMTEIESAAKGSHAANENDFGKLETMLKDVPDEDKPKVRSILIKKWANKKKDKSAKSANDAMRLRELIEKYVPVKK